MSSSLAYTDAPQANLFNSSNAHCSRLLNIYRHEIFALTFNIEQHYTTAKAGQLANYARVSHFISARSVYVYIYIRQIRINFDEIQSLYTYIYYGEKCNLWSVARYAVDTLLNLNSLARCRRYRKSRNGFSFSNATAQTVWTLYAVSHSLYYHEQKQTKKPATSFVYEEIYK